MLVYKVQHLCLLSSLLQCLIYFCLDVLSYMSAHSLRPLSECPDVCWSLLIPRYWHWSHMIAFSSFIAVSWKCLSHKCAILIQSCMPWTLVLMLLLSIVDLKALFVLLKGKGAWDIFTDDKRKTCKNSICWVYTCINAISSVRGNWKIQCCCETKANHLN